MGFEIFDSGIFLGRKISQVFLVWLDLSREIVGPIFWGIQNNLKIGGSARVSRPRSSANKVQPNPGRSSLELSFIISVETEDVLGCL